MNQGEQGSVLIIQCSLAGVSHAESEVFTEGATGPSFAMSTQVTRVAGITGTTGAMIAAMSCTTYFPALASLASALGLGFLSYFESISI